MQNFTSGQLVRFNGKSSNIGDAVYTGQVGIVDFQAVDFVLVNGVPAETGGVVYVRIKGKGKRKIDCIGFTPKSLELP